MHFSMNSIQILAAIVIPACLAAPDLSIGSETENAAGAGRCIDTSRHKPAPTPDELYKTCSVYNGLSCCTNQTAYRIHGDDLYKFQNVVCKKQELSTECKKYFLKDACFFECSPDLSPFYSVENGLKRLPLCESNCDNWFAACQNDFTCTKDWKKAMGENFGCSSDDKCQTVKDKFQNAKSFCEKVWAYSYEVVSDDGDCLRFDSPKIRNASQWNGDEDHQEKNTTDDDCPNKEKDTENSSPAIQYRLILIYLPVILALLSLQSKFY